MRTKKPKRKLRKFVHVFEPRLPLVLLLERLTGGNTGSRAPRSTGVWLPWRTAVRMRMWLIRSSAAEVEAATALTETDYFASGSSAALLLRDDYLIDAIGIVV